MKRSGTTARSVAIGTPSAQTANQPAQNGADAKRNGKLDEERHQ